MFRVAVAQETGESPFGRKAFQQDDEVDRQSVQALSLPLEVPDPAFDGGVYNGVLVVLVWDGGVAAFEEVLVDTAFVIQDLERRLQPLGVVVDFAAREAFVIHSL